MIPEDLIRQLGSLQGSVRPDTAWKARVRARVMAGIRPSDVPSKSLFPWTLLRSLSGAMAVLAVTAVGSLFVLRGSPTQASSIGEIELLPGTGRVEVVRHEVGKEPVTESIEEGGSVRTLRIHAGDVIRTSSGSTIALRFDNNSSAVIKDKAVVKVAGVTSKTPDNEPTAVAVVLEKGTLETVELETTGADPILQVKTPSKTVETTNVAVAVKVDDQGTTSVAAVDPQDASILTMDLGDKLIVAAANPATGTSAAKVPAVRPLPTAMPAASPSPSPAASSDPQPTPSERPASPKPSTGSGSVLDDDVLPEATPFVTRANS